jgi:hypothetical protein
MILTDELRLNPNQISHMDLNNYLVRADLRHTNLAAFNTFKNSTNNFNTLGNDSKAYNKS